MKRIPVCILFILVFFAIETYPQEQFLHPDSVIRQNPQIAQLLFEPGELLIRFKDEVVVNISKSDGKAQTGLASTDVLFSEFGVVEAKKLIPDAQPLPQKQMLRAPTGRDFERPSLHNIYHLKVSTEDYRMFELIEALKEDKNILYAEPNYIYNLTDHEALSPVLTAEDLSAMFPSQQLPDNDLKGGKAVIVPNDPYYGQQWWIGAINADLAWETSTGDANQVIAILDTGVDWQHPDLVNKIWTNPGETLNNADSDGNGYADDIRGWDFINNDNNPMDDNSHGTHVAGIAAAEANNGIGIAGVSWGARIMPIKILQSSGSGNAATIVQGINYAANNGATVINMSFGSYARSLAMEDALAYAYANAVLVAAAGNDGMKIGPPTPPFFPFFPAALSFVIGVEANKQILEECIYGQGPIIRACFSNYDHDGRIFSNYQELFNYEVSAPGTGMISTIPNGSYRQFQGTSMAAPVVSGASALYKTIFPEHSQELFWANLIHSSYNGIKIQDAINGISGPRIDFIAFNLVDTLSGGDDDGKPDAGESLHLWVKLRNTGILANNVKVGVRLGEFEDPSIVDIITGTATIGSISSFAMRTNQMNPFQISISNLANNDRDIILQLYAYNEGLTDTIFQTIVLNIENGEELVGVMDSTLVLSSDKLWLVNGSFRVGINGKLIINPGTRIILSQPITVRGEIIAQGNSEQMIFIEGKNHFGPLFQWQTGNKQVYEYVIFSNSSNILGDWSSCGTISVKNSIFQDITGNYLSNCFNLNFENNIVRNCNLQQLWNFGPVKIINNQFNNNILRYRSGFSMNDTLVNNSFINNSVLLLEQQWISVIFGVDYDFNQEIVIGNSFISTKGGGAAIATSGGNEFTDISQQYWGTLREDLIKKQVVDFWDDSRLSLAVYKPILTAPPLAAHAIVWKVLVNGVDPQDEYFEPVGPGKHRFDVYFNRAMDTLIIPQVSFGVRAPYTQQSINEDGYWSIDRKIYTTFKTISLITGDGINRIRVAGAKELNGWDWEIPIEDQRFEFLIDAAGSASTDFMATPGMGKVELEWSYPEAVEDLLGYNLYRFQHITDTTFTTPLLLNPSLVLDTLYTDFEVLPETKYYYFYKILRTNLAETDSSRIVNSIPLTAAIGDANGDLAVNILDITHIVAYILNGTPQPFIFDAADVNADGQINLLDVIGVVNIIMNDKKSEVLSKPATVYLNTEQAEIKSDGTMAGLQFQLIGKNIEELELKNLPQGFEFIRMINGDTLTGILFNMQNNTLPEGRISLFDIALHPGTLEWGEVFGGNYLGKYIPVFTSEDALPVDHRYSFNVYPNPINEHFVTDIQLPTKSEVQLTLINIYGRSINLMDKAIIESGRHQFRFDKQQLPAAKGLYILQIKIRPLDKNELPFRKEVKLLVM